MFTRLSFVWKTGIKLSAIDRSKQQKVDADAEVTQHINFAEDLEQDGGTTMFFLLMKQNKSF